MSSKPAAFIFPLLFDLIGTGMLVLSFYFYQQSVTFLETAARTEGRVTEYVRNSKSSNSRNNSSYYPIVQFQAPSGETIEFRSNTGSSSKPYGIGESVPVLFDPQNPHEARIEGWFSLWGGAAICAGLGAVFTFVGMTLLISMVRRRNVESWLQTNGQRVRARVIGVEQEVRRTSRARRRRWTSTHTSRTNISFVVVAQWQDPIRGHLHVFRSDPLPYDPQESLRGKEVEVLIDPNNPQRYMFSDPSLS